MLCLTLSAAEFDELPVRHNEDELNAGLSTLLPWPVHPPGSFESPHTKAFLLLQARMARVPLPITDYLTDTKSVLDQALRVLNAMIDVASEKGLAGVAICIMRTLQCLVQAAMPEDNPIQQLPHLDHRSGTLAAVIRALGMDAVSPGCLLRAIADVPTPRLRSALLDVGRLSASNADEVIALLRLLPLAPVKFRAVARLVDGSRTELSTVSSLPPGAVGLSVLAVLPPSPQRRAYVPRLTGRAKDWGWWLVALQGDAEGSDSVLLDRAVLLAVKRVVSSGQHELILPLNSDLGRIRILLVSDCMRGIDEMRPLW